MKKLEIHVFSRKTAAGKNYRVSLLGAIIAVLCVIMGVLGYVLFSPIHILDNITSGNVTNVHRQNVAIKDELKHIRALVDSSILHAEEIRLLRDSTLRIGGLGFIVDNALAEDTLPTMRKSVNEIESSFKKLLAALEKNPLIAERIPVLHPMKNNHAVKKRFEMVYDPFTDRELPHRGIDYVAQIGDTVYATGAGRVIEVRAHRGFGLSIKIDHLNDVRTFYAHLGKAFVSAGANVNRGEPIAIIGESGTQSSIGLHYEIRLDGVSINPENFYITK